MNITKLSDQKIINATKRIDLHYGLQVFVEKMTEKESSNKAVKNAEKFSGIFRSNYRLIFGYVLRRTGSFDDSADITADTFLKAFTHFKNYSERGIPVKSWLYRIATNEINMYFRKKRKYNTVFSRVDFTNKQLFLHYLHLDKEALESELRNHKQFLEVLVALKKLPDKYQNVISLRYFENKDNKEIAEILDMNEGTLKSLLSRGVKKLREKCNRI